MNATNNTTTTNNVTFTRYAGRWAIRVPRKSPLMTGDVVTVHRANGTTSIEVLGALCSAFRWGNVYEIGTLDDNTHAIIAPALDDSVADALRNDVPDNMTNVPRCDDPKPANVPTTRYHIKTDELVYNDLSRTFVAEISDLAAMHNHVWGETINVLNPKTGNVVAFNYVRTDRDREGDVTAWEYHHDPLGLRLVIIND